MSALGRSARLLSFVVCDRSARWGVLTLVGLAAAAAWVLSRPTGPVTGAPPAPLPAVPVAPPMQAPNFSVYLPQDSSGVQNWLEAAAAAEARAAVEWKAGRLDRARDEWRKAVEILQEKVLAKVVESQHRDIVVWRPDPQSELEPLARGGVPASRNAMQAARFVPAVQAVRDILVGWPREGLEVYRSMYTAEAESALRKAVAARRPDEIQAVADRFGNTEAGMRALEITGDLWMDRGGFTPAAEIYLELLGYPTDAGLTAETRRQILAKLAVCAAGAGRSSLFAVGRARLPAGELSDDSTVTISGKTVKLSDFVRPLLERALVAEQTRLSVRARADQNGSCLNFTQPAPALEGQLVKHWPASSPGPMAPEVIIPDPRQIRGSRVNQTRVLHNPFLPAFWGSRMLLQIEETQTTPNGPAVKEQLVVLDLESRRAEDSTLLSQDNIDDGLAEQGANTRIPGRDRYMTVVGNRIFVRTGRPPQTIPNRFRFGPVKELPSTVALRAVDIRLVKEKDSGRLSAKLEVTKIIPPGGRAADLRDWRPYSPIAEEQAFLDAGYFLTAPTAGPDGRLYVGFCKKNEIWLTALESNDGRLVWKTLIAGGHTYQAMQLTNPQIEGTPPTVDGETVYFCSNVGAFAAVTAATGRVKWISVYERPRNAVLGGYSPDALYPWRASPPIVFGGLVFAAPLDDDNLVYFETATGYGGRSRSLQSLLRGSRPRYLIGVAETIDPLTGKPVPAVFLVGNTVVAFDARRRRVLWDAAITEPTNDEDFVVGRPTLAENFLLVPTRKGVIGLDLRKRVELPEDNNSPLLPGFPNAASLKTAEQLVVPIKLPDDFPNPQDAGNLCLYRDRLIAVMTSERGSGTVYVAKSQMSLLEEVSERVFSDRKKLRGLLNAGRADLRAGRDAEAAVKLEQVARALAGVDKSELTGPLFDELADDLRTLADRRPELAIGLLTLSIDLTPAGPARAVGLWLLVDRLLARGQQAEAVDRLQSLLELLDPDRPERGNVAGLLTLYETAALPADAKPGELGTWQADLLEPTRQRIRHLVNRSDNGVALYAAYEVAAAAELAKVRRQRLPNTNTLRQIYLRYPAANAARQALLLLGQTRQKEAEANGALTAFRALRADWPGTADSFKAAAAELEILEAANRWPEARQLFRDLMRFYGKSRLGDSDQPTVEEALRRRVDQPAYAELRGLLEAEPDARDAVVGFGDKPSWSVELPAPAAGHAWSGVRLLSPLDLNASGAGLARSATPSGDRFFVLADAGIEARKLSDGSLIWRAGSTTVRGLSGHGQYPRIAIPAALSANRLLVGLPNDVSGIELRTGKDTFSDRVGRVLPVIDGDAVPRDWKSARMLRLWAATAGAAISPEHIVTHRPAGDIGSVLTAYSSVPPPDDAAADPRIYSTEDAVSRFMGPPLLAGGLVFVMTRDAGLQVYPLSPGKGIPKPLSTPGLIAEVALTAPPSASEAGDFVAVSAGDTVIGYAVGTTVYGAETPLSQRWQRRFVGRTVETLATLRGRTLVRLDNGRVLGLDTASGAVSWVGPVLTSSAGELAEVIVESTTSTAARVSLLFAHSAAPGVAEPSDAARAELVTLDALSGSIRRRVSLDFTSAGGAAAGGAAGMPGKTTRAGPPVWLTPLVIDGQVYVSALLAPEKPADKPVKPDGDAVVTWQLWTLSVDAGPREEPAAATVVSLSRPLVLGKAGPAWPPARIADGVFTVVGDKLIFTDGSSVSAYPIRR